jgi:hypothetical protein
MTHLQVLHHMGDMVIFLFAGLAGIEEVSHVHA